MLSLAILQEPLIENRKISKGAMILSDVDLTLKEFPKLKEYFYLIERRGWEGINLSEHADIKLIEDSSVWEETKKRFPNAILLDIAGADFVDTENFKPLNTSKEYTGIQISAWQKFKRPELFFNGTKLLPEKRFLKFGHLFYGGKDKEELKYKDLFVLSAKENFQNVEILGGNSEDNRDLPNDPKLVNELINKAKIGILTSKVEGINRFKLECLSANIPVIVPKDVNIPLKKHINDKTGIFYEPSPEGLAEAIKKVEENYNKFSPREYVLKNTGNKISLEKLKLALQKLAKRDGGKNIYTNVYWDGRNQSLIWEEKAKIFLKGVMEKIQNEINNN